MPRKKRATLTPEQRAIRALTVREKRLLLNPPTETTWLCDNHETAEGKPESVPNSGGIDVCVWCRQKKPKNAKRLWPEYKALCKKIGVTPGVYWKLSPGTDKVPMTRERGGQWKIQE